MSVVLYVSSRGIATIKLDRPEKGNAIDSETAQQFLACLDRVSANDDIKIVVLRGNGKHFCTGADLTSGARAEGEARVSIHDVLMRLDIVEKATIAVVQGGCIGAGAAIVACCDVAICDDTAFFSFPEVRVGIPPLGVAPSLIRAIGGRAFKKAALMAERITAPEALSLGLIHRMVGPEEIESAVTATCENLLHAGPKAVKTLKRWMHEAAGETAGHPPIGSPEEAAEGIASFRERRKPSWYPPFSHDE
jgi:methylglutaconyl-CoA hydratase